MRVRAAPSVDPEIGLSRRVAGKRAAKLEDDYSFSIDLEQNAISMSEQILPDNRIGLLALRSDWATQRKRRQPAENRIVQLTQPSVSFGLAPKTNAPFV